jgi:hypothetical protein
MPDPLHLSSLFTLLRVERAELQRFQAGQTELRQAIAYSRKQIEEMREYLRSLDAPKQRSVAAVTAPTDAPMPRG